MFIGEYNHTIDAKGRVIMPAKFREELGGIFIVTKGMEDCLYIYTLEEWQSFVEKLQLLPMSNKDARAVSRFFLSGAARYELDKQGRILLTPVHRRYAGLEKEVVVIGVSNRIEIWSQNRWNEINDLLESDMESMALRLEEIGIRF